MLPSHLKLPNSEAFRSTIKQGRRAGRSTVVVHLHQGDALVSTRSPRFGLIVSKAVGNAVIRHRTSRKLRHAIMAVQDHFPEGANVVIRALPKSKDASPAELAGDLLGALEKIQRSPHNKARAERDGGRR